MKQLISFIVFLITVPCFADVTVSKAQHIQNNELGLCAWTSIETMGLAHGWTEIKGLTAGKKKPGHHHEMSAELTKLKIKHQTHQIADTEWWYLVWHQDKTAQVIATVRTDAEAQLVIKNTHKAGDYWVQKRFFYKSGVIWTAVDNNLGAVVSMDQNYQDKAGKWHSARHALIIVGWDKKSQVRFVDSNYSPGTIRTEPLHKFLEWWNGFAIIVEKCSP